MERRYVGSTSLDEAIARLRDPAEIRARSEEILALGERGALAHFDVRTDRLPELARLVAGVTRARYPVLAIPLHSVAVAEKEQRTFGKHGEVYSRTFTKPTIIHVPAMLRRGYG